MQSITPYFEVHDSGNGPFLLLMHGFLSSRAQWRVNLEGLRAFCRPVVVELLGHGRSPAPEALAAYEVGRYHDAFEAIRRQLGAEQLVLCGQSFGAGLTIRYALNYPERVLGQVFTNSNSALSAKPPSGHDAEQEARAQSVEADGLAAIEAMRIHPKHARRLPPDVQRELVEDAARISPRAIAHSIRVTRPALSVIAESADLKVPSMLVNGFWEKRFQPLRDRAAARLPGGRVVDLPGGHGVNIDAAVEFNRTVAAFIASL